jgi:hypothetical protein
VAWDAYISHHLRRSSGEVFRQLFSYGRGNGRSRYIERHTVKLAAVYALGLALAGGAVFASPLAGLLLILLGAYYYRAGLRKIIEVDGGLKRLSYLWLPAAVLFPRDLGSLLGHLVGWLEWLLVPRYRALFRAYTEDCDRSALARLSD